MSRRERLEAKLEKRQEWAGLASQRSSAAFKQGERMASVIPMGQPILIGHHSEKRDRNYRERIHNTMRRGCDLANLAEHHQSKAAGLEAQLEHSIFSDDPDAIEAIEERIRANEAAREQMKLINKLYKKGDVEGLKALGLDYENLKAKLAALGNYFGQAPHMPYELTNTGARILADKKRIQAIKARQIRAEQAEQAGGVMITRHNSGYASVTFAEKPERSIINDLKAAGFHWSGGSWFGTAEKIPASVIELEQPVEAN